MLDECWWKMQVLSAGPKNAPALCPVTDKYTQFRYRCTLNSTLAATNCTPNGHLRGLASQHTMELPYWFMYHNPQDHKQRQLHRMIPPSYSTCTDFRSVVGLEYNSQLAHCRGVHSHHFGGELSTEHQQTRGFSTKR